MFFISLRSLFTRWHLLFPRWIKTKRINILPLLPKLRESFEFSQRIIGQFTDPLLLTFHLTFEILLIAYGLKHLLTDEFLLFLALLAFLEFNLELSIFLLDKCYLFLVFLLFETEFLLQLVGFVGDHVRCACWATRIWLWTSSMGLLDHVFGNEEEFWVGVVWKRLFDEHWHRAMVL